MRVRPAGKADLEDVYAMGYDAWGGPRTVADYLASCAESAKYREGEWRVLDDDGRLLSSLIVYRLEAPPARAASGLGSIATPPLERGRGRASALIAGVLKTLDERGDDAVFLYSDIDPRFYERFGFRALPAALQRYPRSVCMLRARPELRESLPGSASFRAPDYF